MRPPRPTLSDGKCYSLSLVVIMIIIMMEFYVLDRGPINFSVTLNTAGSRRAPFSRIIPTTQRVVLGKIIILLQHKR